MNVGQTLFTVVNTSELELAGQVGVEEAARVRAGQSVAFSLDVYPGRVLRGRVARVDPTADPGTRQVGVFVRLPNPGNEIIGGQFAQGRIETGGTASALTIPDVTVEASDFASWSDVAAHFARERRAREVEHPDPVASAQRELHDLVAHSDAHAQLHVVPAPAAVGLEL